MKKIYFFLLTPCLFLTSCIALHDGILQPSVTLETNNFAYIKTVSGSATATYIFGIGGNRDGLVQSSLNEFRSNLKQNQALVNISVDERRTWFIIPLLYQQKKIFVSADIIEFTNQGEAYKIKRKDENISINIGEDCMVEINGKMRKAKLLNYLKDGKVEVKLIYNNEKIIMDEKNVFVK